MEKFDNVNQIDISGIYLSIEFVEHSDEFVGLIIDDPDKLITIDASDSGKLKILTKCENMNNVFGRTVIINGQVLSNQSFNQSTKTLPKLYAHINNTSRYKKISIDITCGQVTGNKILSNLELNMSGNTSFNINEVCNDMLNISCSGNSKIFIGLCKCDDFEISSSGSSSVKLEVCDSRSMKCSMSGNASYIVSSGSCFKFNGSFSGNCNVINNQIITSKMRCIASGCSNVKISNCNDEDADIKVSGCSHTNINGKLYEKKNNRSDNVTIVTGHGNVIIGHGNVVTGNMNIVGGHNVVIDVVQR